MKCFMPGQTVRKPADSYIVVAIMSCGGTYSPSRSRGLSRQDADALALSMFENEYHVEVRQRVDVTVLSGIAKPRAFRARVTAPEYPVIDGWHEWETVSSFTRL